MKKRSRIIIARIIAALMVFSILPFDMLTTANVVMAQELGDNAESGSTIDNEAGDSDNGASISNPESNGDNKDAGLGEETTGNTDSSNGEDSDNKEGSSEEGSDNMESSDTEGSDNKDDSDAENPDVTGDDSQDVEDPETTPDDEEGLGDASVEASEEEAVVKKASTVRASGFSNVGGWCESIYAEIAGVEASNVTEVSYSGTMTGSLSTEDLKYLVRNNGSDTNKSVRIDIPGLKAGTYTLTVKVDGSPLTKSGITVSAYDRSGYAHFGYTEGVGAYKDDGTLKDNAIVLYVTDDNKNDVELTVNKTTVKGIGNILNSSSSASKGIIKALADAKKPLVVRFVGMVSNSGLRKRGTFDVKENKGEINGLTAYASTTNGGNAKDNGHLARIQSGKDVTLEGIGYDATIDGWGFHYIAKSSDPDYGKSFEVRNLKFINTPEDAVGMEGVQASNNTSSDLSASVERCWIHNNEFYCPSIANPAESDKGEGDGSVDFKRGQYFTCSYNYFEGCHKTNLVGSDDYILQFNLTYHHNHWYMCDQRGPLSRNANIHMYNNIVDMQTGYAQNVRANAYIFSEYNMFYACIDPQKVDNGAIKSYHDSISSVAWNSSTTQGTIVQNKTDYVENACQFEAREIKYDKFDVDPKLSYIPTGDYILEEDFTNLRKIIKSQAGVQDREPKSADELSSNDYSMMPSGTTVNQITLPYDKAPGKNKVFAFSVGQNFDLEVGYSSGTGVLVNEAGENLLEGDGSVTKLPKGTYWIQSVSITKAIYKSNQPATFKDITISKLKITPNNTAGHEHNWVLDTTKSKDATCTETGKKVYTCSCNDTKEETVAVLGHNYSDWTVTKPATATEAGSKERTCSRCSYKQTEVIPATGSGGGTSDVTPEGAHVLTFPGKAISDPDKFFTVNSAGGFADKKGPVTVNGKEYSECLKFGSSTVSFTCTEGATLFMAFEQSGKIKVNGETKDIGSDGTITLKNLPAGTYEISKVSGNEALLFYISVFNPAPEVNTYTLTFKYNYADAPEAKEIEVNKGTTYNSMSELVPAPFTRSGYTLKGLYTDAECNMAVEYPYTVTKNATLYAKWDAELKYTIVYKPGNEAASGDFASVVAKANDEITLPTCVAVEGYTFTGWSVDGITPISGDKYTVNPKDASTENIITITALYNVTVYDIEYDSNGGTLPTQGLPQKGKTGQTLTLGDCTPANSATHSFVGWSVRNAEPVKEYIVNPTDAVNGTITLKAVYKEKTVVYAIKFDANGGTLSSDLSEMSREAGAKIDLSTYKPTRDGQRFVGWQIKGVELSGSEYTVNAADADENKVITIKALYKTEYTVIFDVGKGTLPSGMVSGNKYIEGETVTLGECTPPSSQKFIGWMLNGNENNLVTSSYVVNEADVYEDSTITFKALYAPEGDTTVYYTVILDTDGGTLVEGGETERKVKENETIDPGACEKTGYVFKGWTVDGNTVTMPYKVTKDVTLKAAYEKVTYTVKFDAGEGTLPAEMQAEVTAKTGDSLTLGDCTAPTGQKFIGWMLNGSENNLVTSPYIVNAADADEDSTITFKALYASEGDTTVYYIVILDTDGGTLVNGGGIERKVKENGTIDPGACEKAEYEFKGWTVDGEAVKVPYTVTKDVTLKAAYEKVEEEPSHKGIAIVGLEKEYEFTGAKIIPNIAVVDYDIKGDDGKHGKVLNPGVDYTVKYANNSKVTTDAKPATVTVTGKGNYAGKDTQATFKIVEAKAIETTLEDLKGAKLSKINPVEYTGKPQYPEIELTLKKGTPTKYTYDEEDGVYKVKEGTAQGAAIGAKVSLSNNINKGTATILLTGKNGANGKATTIKKTFKITPIDISKENKLTVVADPATYSVKGAVPAKLTVHYKDDNIDKDLINGVDYTVKYSSNKKAGVKAGKIAITGKGNYAKKYTAAIYDINPLVWSAEDTDDKNPIKAVQVYAGLKAVKVKATVVDKDGNVLKPSQYTLKVYKKNGDSDGDSFTEYTKSDDALKANDVIYVEATAKEGNTDITGTTAKAEFKVGNNIAKAKFVLNKVNGKAFTAQYTGEEIELNPTDLTVTMKGVSGKLKASPEVLGNNEEYAYEIVSYSNNINKGTATAVIKGINGYSGTKTVKFKIVGKTMAIDEENRNIPWKDIPGQFKSFMDGILN